MALTDTSVRNVKPSDKPKRLYDTGGLYLEVSPKGGKWRVTFGCNLTQIYLIE